MSNKHWKNVEREVAERFGGKRMGATGIDDADVHTDDFCIQVKYRKGLPEWLTHAFNNAARNAIKHDLIGFTIIKWKGMFWKDAIVMIPLSQFEEILSEAGYKLPANREG